MRMTPLFVFIFLSLIAHGSSLMACTNIISLYYYLILVSDKTFSNIPNRSFRYSYNF